MYPMHADDRLAMDDLLTSVVGRTEVHIRKISLRWDTFRYIYDFHQLYLIKGCIDAVDNAVDRYIFYLNTC